MTEELKQAAQQALMECPFCGSEPHDAHHIEYGRWAVTCRCGTKGASANTGPNATDAAKIKAYSDARTAWNTRALAQRPAAQAGEVDIKSRVSELIAEHGTLRAAARSLNIDVGYLSRLEHGDKVHPSSETLAKIGLRDAGVKYQRLVFLPTQPAAQATPEPDVAHLVASIKDDAKHAAYMAEIDNTDARDNYLHKLALSLDDLASRVHQQATPEPLHLFEFWWESHMPQATQSQAWAAWAAAQSSKGATIDAAQATPGFDDCAKSPTGKHSESWFGNGDCEHCKSGAQIAPMVSATPEPRLFIGACITDGRLHATVQRLESNGDVTLVATAKMDAASLHGHDCIAQMTPVAPTQQAAGEPVGFALVPMTKAQVRAACKLALVSTPRSAEAWIESGIRFAEEHHAAMLAAAQAKGAQA